MADDDDVGVGFWDVEGVPVFIREEPDCSLICRAVNEDGSLRPFSFERVVGSAAELTAEEFAQTFPYAAHHARRQK
jgi:hypothetical protein